MLAHAPCAGTANWAPPQLAKLAGMLAMCGSGCNSGRAACESLGGLYMSATAGGTRDWGAAPPGCSTGTPSAMPGGSVPSVRVPRGCMTHDDSAAVWRVSWGGDGSNAGSAVLYSVQYSAVQCSSVQSTVQSTVQYSTMCSAVRFSAEYSAVQCRAQCSIVQCAVQCVPVQCTTGSAEQGSLRYWPTHLHQCARLGNPQG